MAVFTLSPVRQVNWRWRSEGNWALVSVNQAGVDMAERFVKTSIEMNGINKGRKRWPIRS